MAEPEAVLFDIDGTLIESGGASHVSWQRAFEDLYGLGTDIDESTLPGMPDPEVGRAAFEGALGREPTRHELARLMAKRLEHLGPAVAESEGYRVIDGVAETLERLTAAGILLGLTTGNVEAAAHIKLARGRLNRFFGFGGYGSDSPDRTELTRCAVERAVRIAAGSLEVAECIAVGDTPRDVEAGHGAGVRVVGVATGSFAVADLEAAGAEWAIPSLAEGFPL